MATTDTIAFVKESKTCAYVLVVHTPRLCGEPGFMSSRDAGEQASTACREVVAGEPSDQSDAAFLPDADHPLKLAHTRPKLPPPPPAKVKDAASGGGKYGEALRKALDTLKELNWQSGEVEMLEDGEGNVVIQFVDEIPLEDEEFEILDDTGEDVDRIAHVLREAGFDIKIGALPGKTDKKKKNGDEKQDENDGADRRRRKIDELL